MSRPGEKFTLKTIQIQNKMKEIDPPSKSLLANVLDMDDDFKTSPTLPPAHFSPQINNHISLNNQLSHKNGGLFRWAIIIIINIVHCRPDIRNVGILV